MQTQSAALPPRIAESSTFSISPSPANSSSSSNQTYLKYFPNGSLMDLIFFGSSKPLKTIFCPVRSLTISIGLTVTLQWSPRPSTSIAHCICSKTLPRNVSPTLRSTSAQASSSCSSPALMPRLAVEDFMLPRPPPKRALVYSPVLSSKSLRTPSKHRAVFSCRRRSMASSSPSGRLVLPISFSRTFSRFAIFSPPFRNEGTMGLCPKPRQKPEVSGLPTL